MSIEVACKKKHNLLFTFHFDCIFSIVGSSDLNEDDQLAL